MRFAGMLEKLNQEEAVSGHPLDRLDEVGSQVQPVAGFLMLACSYEGLELRALFARREAEVRPPASNFRKQQHQRLCEREGLIYIAAISRAGAPNARPGRRA